MAYQKLFESIESAAKNGKFGDNFKLVSLTPSDLQGEDHFASDVVFAVVRLQNGSSEKSVHVVIKQQQNNEFIRNMMNTDAQFYNEVLVYNEILPSLEQNGIVSDTFPKMIYGKATLGENFDEDIVVVDDLRQANFRLTREKLFLDYKHCALILKKIARFHALSYIKKQENFEEFSKLVKKLREFRYVENNREESNKFLGITLYRGVVPLEKESDEYKLILDKLKKKFEDPFNMMKTLCQPEEPMAVLCHGDFCRNNMIFLYDGDDNPVDVRFFDVATARYASPAIDLVFFLFMNTTPELRRCHWDDLLKIYYEALCAAVTPECSIFSLEAFKEEVTVKAIYAYTLCSFFIPMMMEENKELHDFTTMTPEEIEAFTKIRGGEEATKIITDILRDIVRLQCA